MRFIGKVLGLLIGLPIMLVAVLFAVANFQPVSFGLYPFDFQVELSLALALFLFLLLGFLIGAGAEFIRGGRKRRDLRAAQFRLRSLEIEAARAKRDAEAREDSAKAANLPAVVDEAKPPRAA
jgi:uncharacterized integral membrane protein